MNRRKFITILSTVTAVGISGCSEEPDQAPVDDSSEQSTDDSTDTPSEQSNDESTEDSSEGDPSYQVRISYNGEWSGSISEGGSSRSVDGSGTETFDIDGNPSIVSVNAQKSDDSSNELTVEILQDGEVIARETTSAEYGLAQVTSEDESDGGTDSGDTYEVRIEYDGEWQGSVSTGGSTRSIEGSETKTIGIDGSPDVISTNAQKMDDSSQELTIQIIRNGEVVKQTSTTAEYGIAQVSYSNF